jgi:diguanylate cyclase (GGDEF)-like protein
VKDRGAPNAITVPQMPAVHELDFEDDEVTDVTQGARDSEVSPPKAQVRGALVVLRGLETGRMFLLENGETMIGRDRDAHVHYDDRGLSRKHARIVREGSRYFIEDQSSRNGTFVDGERVERAELREGARVVLSATVVLRFNLVDPIEEHVSKQLYEASTRDALTDVYNRRYLDERLAAEVSFAHRHAGKLGFILFDIDHFKKVNDTHGHPAGDAVLGTIAKRVAKLIRVEDVLARYGGEEFAIVVRGIPMEGLVALAERIRAAVAASSAQYQNLPIPVTVSVGVASLEECDAHATGDLLVALADERLYRAKHEGRNRVCST